ncbi:nicotinate-nucleotide adenylyltransferase [Enterovirga aerilata]|uniref:Probable nicotinate-nucleotide adenylyltransferase n=1 Tax=Enterovirga aerilata TaxID=2730920 RepID=A0A849HTS3_9HYPH|nr:nicotinate-nucleotide adenylyltransferase [Enterovirga sp. DB1703]NNM70896.1 nicotinate-nucleotide adenylyltransferase [Enterovirga sp. DB1703]
MEPAERGGLIRLPPTAAGLRIGLYGGSFDPPHAGHRHVAMAALRRLGLDRVWWIVGPGNPLKDTTRLPTVAERLAATRSLAGHPRMVVTGFEAELGARYTVDTLRFLTRRCPRVRFVYILGADSFANLHRWRAWREITSLVPLAVVDRPGWTLRALRSPAARTLPLFRVPPQTLAGSGPPAWTFLTGPRSNLSSTALRDKLLKTLDRR